MKKKLLFILLLMVLVLPVSVNANTTTPAKEKVKVYIFEAGGCPACEAQIKYLKSLDSYNKQFEIVELEEYVDHINWQPGKYYDLGVKVAEAYYKAGYQDASSNATPFVVISDLYAAANYNPNLESVINDVYEVGDKDVVGCFMNDGKDCANYIKVREVTPTDEPENTITTDTIKDNTTNIAIIICAAVMVTVYLVKSTIDTNKVVEAINNKK